MKWHYLNTAEGTGKFNMELDKFLARNVKTNEAYFRLYRWKPYCLSLGANQNIATVNMAQTAVDGIDIVFRPTGGRAILHSEELTYSVILPKENISSAKNVYHDINLALADGLARYNPKLSSIELETEQPRFNELYKTFKGDICFAVPAKSELKFNGKKLVGSAQRRMESGILQHGSILCGGFHKNILSYLNLSEEEKEVIKSGMELKTIELEITDYTDLIANEKEFSIKYEY
jgi:lipoate-protein ligase A